MSPELLNRQPGTSEGDTTAALPCKARPRRGRGPEASENAPRLSLPRGRVQAPGDFSRPPLYAWAALLRRGRVTPLELLVQHWRRQLERWLAEASLMDRLAAAALAALGATLLFDWL